MFAQEQSWQEIYRGRQHLVRRIISPGGAHQVVKTVLDEAPGRAEAEARLQIEHDLLTTMDLPGVVKSLGLRREGGRLALFLEDVGAQNLKQWLRRRPMPAQDFLRMAIAITEALAGLHARNIVHRDLNPTNIVVDRDRRIALIDFESAVLLGGSPEPGAAPAELEGTLPYIAPEQTGRMNRKVDHRADLYSLGVTFYEMLTSAPPFGSSDPIELVHAHLARTPVPPASANPQVPALLSDLVLRLLAKMPEQRYQTARSLLVDLTQAQARLESTGALSAFELGQADLAQALPLPDRLYGRQGEIEQLRAAWRRVASGGRELLLVAGEAGVGKSALLVELRDVVTGAGGRLALGKFDVREGQTPYAPLVQGLGGVLRALNEHPTKDVTALKQRLTTALGSSAAVMTNLLPDLAALLEAPAHAPLPALGTVETENRFVRAFLAFLRALASAEHPLVLCFDDVQWADNASLKLLRLIAGADLPHAMLVVAYRSDEVKPDHPSTETLAALRGAGPHVIALNLGPLGLGDLQSLCADALVCDRDRVAPLCRLLVRKTAGNPFFVRQLLRFLQRRELLRFDPSVARWIWDLSRIEEVNVTDKVADLMVQTLQWLPDATRAALSFAACVGGRVPVDLVAAASRQSREATLAALFIAVSEGHLVPTSVPHGPTAEGIVFHFVHDRIQQAAYGLLSGTERARVHAQIGQQLLSDLALSGGPADDQKLFTAADQLVLGADQLQSPADRIAAIELLLRAALKARASSAYGPALHYLERAIKLLPRQAWTSHHDLAATLHSHAMECAFVTDQPVLGNDLLEVALARAHSAVEKANLYVLRVDALMAQMAFAEAAALAMTGLGLFDVTLPGANAADVIAAELTSVAANLNGRSTKELLDARLMTGAAALACMRLLQQASATTYYTQPQVWPFVAARLVNMTLRHGNTGASAVGFVSYAVLLQRTTGDYQRALELGQLGVALAERLGDPVQFCRAVAVFGSSVSSWLEPLESRIPLLREAQQRGIEAGEFLHAMACPTTIVMLLFHKGVELSHVLAELEAGLASARATNVRSDSEALLAYRLTLAKLAGPGLPGVETSNGCIEPDRNGAPALCRHEILRLGTAYLLRDLEQARRLSRSSRQTLASVPRAVSLVEHNFYTSLTLAGCCDGAAAAEKTELLAEIADHQRELAVWAGNAPQNYAHKHQLVSAELARLEDRPLEAAELFEQAIESAAREQFLQDEALGNELCGRFHRAHGRKRFARRYLSSAVEGYRRWGANAKAEALEVEFPELGDGAADVFSSHHSLSHPRRNALDVATLLRTAETLSREVVPSRLLGKLMEVCLSTAGAQRGALVMASEGDLLVRATGTVSESPVLHREPLASSRLVPVALIERVRASQEALVLQDACNHHEFHSDGYVAQRGVRSAMALPIVRQGKFVGVLYLENNLATQVFTPDRVQLLTLLSGQIATSLQNSFLFERLTSEIEERKRAESNVRFLSDAGAALSESLDYQATLNEVARLAIPSLADWCVIDLLENDKIRRVATAHVDAEKQALLARLGQMEDEHQPRPHIAHVVATRTPLLYDHVTTPMLERYTADPSTTSLMQWVGVKSCMVLPLVARGRSVGAISLGSVSDQRRFTTTDLALAQELARRAANAIDNARLYGELQEAVRLRDEFLSIASHELNTPIASLSLMVQGLEEGPGTVAPAVLARTTQIISRQTRRLKTLVGDLLDLAHIHAGQLHLRCSETDLSGLLRDTLDRFAEDLARARCTVTLSAPAEVVGNWDRSRLEQVMTNLLSNAIKFGPGKPIDITIIVSADAQTAQVTVTDQGIGIAAESVPNIFGRYERAVSSANYGGLGLGLYIVREIVHAHAGSVAVRSQLGAGCTFTVQLPLARAQPVVPSP